LRFVLYSGSPVTQDGAGSRGSSWADIDGDGDEDLFVSNRQNQDNLLYINNTEDPQRPVLDLVEDQPVIMDGGDSQGSSFGDYDNDGDLDLYVANRRNQKNFFYRNNGDGSFEKITEGPHVNDTLSSTSVSWVDINNDGYLDLFTASRNDEPNAIYINDTRGSFTKLESGLIVEDIENIRACAWNDLDGNGYQDLFAGNANGTNSIYLNNGDLTFTKVTEGSPVNEEGYTYGVSTQDVNNDGHADLFVANLYQPNTLHLNNGDGTFKKVTSEDIVQDEGHSKGLVWQDFDNDGDLDLFVSNGIPGSVQDHFYYQNQGEGTFIKLTDVAIVKHGGLAGGSSSSDINGDGRMDLLVTNWVDNANNRLFFNVSDNSNNWIQILPVGKKLKTPYGTLVNVHYIDEDQTQRKSTQYLLSQSGYGSQSSLYLHFGIAKATQIDSVSILWPQGKLDTYTGLEKNKRHIIEEL